MNERHEAEYAEKLSAYIDGDLRAHERADLERHLEGCADCRALLAELRAVVSGASALEERMPETDLWPAIEARLAPRAPAPLPWPARFAPRYAFTLPQLAAAAALLVALGGGGTWLALQGSLRTATGRGALATHPDVSGRVGAPAGGAAGSTNAGGGSLAVNGTTAGPTTGVATAGGATPAGAGPGAAQDAVAADAQLANFDARRYDQSIAQLQQVVQAHRAELDTSTVRIVEQNLAIIDRAIAEARRALAADPGNPYLSGHLAQQLQRKVRLLQQTTDLLAVREG